MMNPLDLFPLLPYLSQGLGTQGIAGPAPATAGDPFAGLPSGTPDEDAVRRQALSQALMMLGGGMLQGAGTGDYTGGIGRGMAAAGQAVDAVKQREREYARQGRHDALREVGVRDSLETSRMQREHAAAGEERASTTFGNQQDDRKLHAATKKHLGEVAASLGKPEQWTQTVQSMLADPEFASVGLQTVLQSIANSPEMLEEDRQTLLAKTQALAEAHGIQMEAGMVPDQRIAQRNDTIRANASATAARSSAGGYGMLSPESLATNTRMIAESNRKRAEEVLGPMLGFGDWMSEDLTRAKEGSAEAHAQYVKQWKEAYKRIQETDWNALAMEQVLGRFGAEGYGQGGGQGGNPLTEADLVRWLQNHPLLRDQR